jgi:hypothetical protein
VRLIRHLAALALGAVTGALAAVSHAALVPIGAVIAVLGSFAAIRLIGLRLGGRTISLAAAVGWIAVVLRGSIEGFAGELIVWDSSVGTAFLAAGALAVVVATILPMASS